VEIRIGKGAVLRRFAHNRTSGRATRGWAGVTDLAYMYADDDGLLSKTAEEGTRRL